MFLRLSESTAGGWASNTQLTGRARSIVVYIGSDWSSQQRITDYVQGHLISRYF